MVNGKSLEEELKNIEEFFNEMSQEEFCQLMINCGCNYKCSLCNKSLKEICDKLTKTE